MNGGVEVSVEAVSSRTAAGMRVKRYSAAGGTRRSGTLLALAVAPYGHATQQVHGTVSAAAPATTAALPTLPRALLHNEQSGYDALQFLFVRNTELRAIFCLREFKGRGTRGRQTPPSSWAGRKVALKNISYVIPDERAWLKASFYLSTARGLRCLQLICPA